MVGHPARKPSLIIEVLARSLRAILDACSASSSGTVGKKLVMDQDIGQCSLRFDVFTYSCRVKTTTLSYHMDKSSENVDDELLF